MCFYHSWCFWSFLKDISILGKQTCRGISGAASQGTEPAYFWLMKCNSIFINQQHLFFRIFFFEFGLPNANNDFLEALWAITSPVLANCSPVVCSRFRREEVRGCQHTKRRLTAWQVESSRWCLLEESSKNLRSRKILESWNFQLEKYFLKPICARVWTPIISI